MSLLLVFLVGFAIGGYFWYRVLRKMGFEPGFSWLLVALLIFPLTSLFSLIYLAFAPWPIHKKLKQRSHSPMDEIENELDRMRGDMGMNQMKKRMRGDMGMNQMKKRKRQDF